MGRVLAMKRGLHRRRILTTVGTLTVAGSIAGCSFSYSSSDNRLSMEETVEFDADEGQEIRVRISSGSGGSDDTASSDTGRAELFDPNGQSLVELSFSDQHGDRTRDEETLTAPTSGTYLFENGGWTVTATIEVDGEAVL